MDRLVAGQPVSGLPRAWAGACHGACKWSCCWDLIVMGFRDVPSLCKKHACVHGTGCLQDEGKSDCVSVEWSKVVRTHMHAHTRMHTHTHTHMSTYTHKCTHTHTLIYTCTHTHMRTFTHTHAYTHAHTHTHMQAQGVIVIQTKYGWWTGTECQKLCWKGYILKTFLNDMYAFIV